MPTMYGDNIESVLSIQIVMNNVTLIVSQVRKERNAIRLPQNGFSLVWGQRVVVKRIIEGQ